MAQKASGAQGAPPSDRELVELLGRSSAHWKTLHQHLTSEFGPLDERWSYSGKTERWSLQLKRRRNKRTILYMIVCSGHFLAGFALGEKACQAAHAGALSEAVLEIIDQAPKFGEGRGVWLEVRTKADLDDVKRLAGIKMAN
jgi:hypothetical protein